MTRKSIAIIRAHRRKLAGGLGVVAALGLGSLAVRFLFPLETAELMARMELRSSGITSIAPDGIHAYSRDLCRAHPRSSTRSDASCTCVAFIHGLGDNALTWKRLLQRAPGDWLEPVRLFAFDLPGSGETPPPASQKEYRARLLAGRLAKAMASVTECKSWLVAGNSFGGWIAAWLALDHSRLVSRLMLVDSAGLRGQASRSSTLLTEPTVESLKEFQRRAYHKPRPLPENVWAAAAERARRGNSRAVREAQIPEDDLDVPARSIRVPTMVFWGLSDQVTLPAEGRQLAQLIPNAFLREAPECGHLPQKECPVALLKALNEMLTFGSI